MALTRQAHFHAGQLNTGREQVNALVMVQDTAEMLKILVMDNLFHDSRERDRQALIIRPAQSGSQITLGVCVNEKYLFPLHGKPDSEICRGRGFGHAAFLVAYRYDAAIL